MSSKQSVTEINAARSAWNQTHPAKPRALLTPMSPFQRAKVEEHMHVASKVAQLYSAKGLDFEELKSACLEAIVRCAIKQDTAPYAYTLVFQCCRDVCVDMLRVYYKERNLLQPVDEDLEQEMDEPTEALLEGLLADAPGDMREAIVDFMGLTKIQIKVKYDMGEKMFHLMEAEVKAYVKSYLFD